MTTTPDDRRDLAAMVAPLARTLIAAEEPVLRAHKISMWGYIVLTALASEPIRTQAALAQVIGADKSRIIGVLDELQEQALIERYPDPADRRVHLLALTASGEQRRHAVQAEIRRNEEKFLACLPSDDREVFLRSLQLLSNCPDVP